MEGSSSDPQRRRGSALTAESHEPPPVIPRRAPVVVSVSALVVAVGMLAGCGTSRPLVSPTTTSVVPVSNRGLVAADPRLADRIVLARVSAPAGRTIAGTLIVTSRASAAINRNRPCRPDYVVALSNGHYQPDVAWASVCRPEPLTIQPGVNRLPISVLTTYLSCGQPGSTPVAACLNHTVANLPAGTYWAVLFGDGLPLPAPSPVMVTLT